MRFVRLPGLCIRVTGCDHDHAVADYELGVLDASFVALDFNAYLEAEGAA